MTAKDSVCTNNSGTAVPYIARSPDDAHYGDPSRFMTYTTFTNNVPVIPTGAYSAAVATDANSRMAVQSKTI